MISHILYMIFIGFFVGVIARAIYPGDNKLGFWKTVLLGVAGSVGTNFVVQALTHRTSVGFVGSIIGAVVILWVWSKLSK